MGCCRGSRRMPWHEKARYAIVSAASIYVLLGAALWTYQGSLIFIGSHFRTLHEVPLAMRRYLKIETLTRRNGEKLRLATTINEGLGKPRGVLLFFGGNGETMEALLWRCRIFAQYQFKVVGMELPGYGESVGPVGLRTALEAADLTYTYVQEQAKDLDVPVFLAGSSLGTFLAVHCAKNPDVHKVLLHAPLTSLADVAAKHYWFFPVRKLIDPNYTFDNRAQISRLVPPGPQFYILHGNQDEIVPQSNGLEIADLIRKQLRDPASVVFHSADGYDHNDVPLERDGPFGDQISEFFFRDALDKR
eukprot:g46762.t1